MIVPKDFSRNLQKYDGPDMGESGGRLEGAPNTKFIPTPESNRALANKIAQDLGGTIKPAKVDGWTVNIPITYNNKPSVDINGNFINDIVLTHIPITGNTTMIL